MFCACDVNYQGCFSVYSVTDGDQAVLFQNGLLEMDAGRQAKYRSKILGDRISLRKTEESIVMKHVKTISVKKAIDWSSGTLTSIITALTELLALVSTLSTLFGKESSKD